MRSTSLPCPRPSRSPAAFVALGILFGVTASGVTTSGVARADKAACLAAYDSGQRDRLGGRLVKARESTLRCAQSDCPAAIVGECTKWLGELDAEVPTLIVSARDASGGDVLDAKVFIDDKEVAARVDGRPLAVDPGQHTVGAVRGETRAEARIVVAQRELGRRVTVSFAPVLAASAAPSATASAPPPPPPVAPSRTLGWAFAGVSFAALGVFTGLGFSARSDRADLKSSCFPHCSNGAVSSAQTKAYVADAFLGLSLIAAGISVYGFVRKGDAASVSLRVAPHGASLFGSF